MKYLEDWGFDTEAIDKYVEKFGGGEAITAATRLPFRYDTRSLYGFCVPKLDTEGVTALSENTIKTFKKLF